MLMLKRAVADAVLLLQGTVANNVKEYDPAVAGVPPIECDPSEFTWMLRPAGSDPLFTVNDG